MLSSGRTVTTRNSLEGMNLPGTCLLAGRKWSWLANRVLLQCLRQLCYPFLPNSTLASTFQMNSVFWLLVRLSYPLSKNLGHISYPQTWMHITHHLRHLVKNIGSPVSLPKLSISRCGTDSGHTCVCTSHLLIKAQETLCNHSVQISN